MQIELIGWQTILLFVCLLFVNFLTIYSKLVMNSILFGVIDC